MSAALEEAVRSLHAARIATDLSKVLDTPNPTTVDGADAGFEPPF